MLCSGSVEARGDLDVIQSKFSHFLHEGLIIPSKVRTSNFSPQSRQKRAEKKSSRQFIPDLSTFVPGEGEDGALLGPGDSDFELFGCCGDDEARKLLAEFMKEVRSAGSSPATSRVSLRKCSVGPIELSSSDVLAIHFYKTKSRPLIEITGSDNHKIGLRIHVSKIFRFAINGCVLHLQLGDPAVLLLKGASNFGVTSTDTGKYFNISIEASTPLVDVFDEFRNHWVQQWPWLMLAKATAVCSVGVGRLSSVFRHDSTNFSEARAAYKDAATTDESRYTDAPINRLSREMRTQRREYLSRALRLWRQRRGSVRVYCPFCFQALFVKHAQFDDGNKMPALFTVSKPHVEHSKCSSHFIYETAQNSGSDERSLSDEEDDDAEASPAFGEEYENEACAREIERPELDEGE